MKFFFLCCINLFLFALSFTSSKCLAIDAKKNIFPLSKILSSELSSRDAPSRIYKSNKNQFWMFFEQNLVVLSGNSSQKTEFRDISSIKNRREFTPYISENLNGVYFSLGYELYLYSYNTDDFTLVELDLGYDDYIRSVEKDSFGNIWVVSFLSLIKVDTEHKIHRFTFPEDFIDADAGSPILLASHFDLSNNLFLASYSFGLLRFNESEGFSAIAPELKENQSVETLLYINGSLLIGNTMGLYKYDVAKKTLRRIYENSINEHIKQISVDSENIYIISNSNIWKISTSFSQMAKLNLQLSHQINSKSIEISTIYIDDENILWLSIIDEGVFSYHPSRNKLTKSNFELDEIINSQDINILEDSEIHISNRDSSFISSLNLRINHPTYSYLEHEQSIYLGSRGHIIHIPPNKQSVQIPYSESSLFPDEKITYLTKDLKQRIWLVSEDTGLELVKLNGSNFQILSDELYIPDTIRSKIRFTSNLTDHEILFASPRGIYLYNIVNDTYENISPVDTSNIIIIDFKRNKNDLYLYASDNQVYIFNLITRIATPLDIPVTNIGCILRQSDSWLISQTNGSLYQWKDNVLTTYNKFDGVPEGGLNGKNCIMFKGKSYFSAFDGIYSYNPENSKPNILKPFTKIQSVDLNNKSYLSVKSNNTYQSLEKEELPITFNIASSSYVNTEKNRYQYRFKNNQSAWRNFSAITKKISFDSLSPDSYTIEFRSSNNDGLWSDPVEFKFIVNPPIWLTIWAKLSYLCIILLSAYAFYSQRLKYAQRRATILEQQVLQRTDALNKEKLKVESLLSQKNEEFANVSHEFRTPLTLILGPLSQLIKTNRNSEEVIRLNVIQRNSYRLLRMVDQLLNIETFRIKSISRKSPQAIGQIIQLLIQAFSDLAKEKDIQITATNIIDVNFEFTPDAIEKIVLNLLSNAIKYTKPGGKISVEVFRTTNNELEIKVSDTGIGIPSDKLKSVFQRYNRVLDESSEQVTGAGIGLALVKELVEAHEGHIQIESLLSQGTKVTIKLPIIGEVDSSQISHHINDEVIAMELMGLSHQITPNTDDNAIAISRNQDDKPTVVVIEDNLDMRNYIKSSITDEYQVFTAINGEQGLELAVKEVPDLIISDIMMPKMDGYQTTQALRNNNITNHIPIILLTARGDRESRLKGWFEKADEYLTKPFDIEELKIRLNNLLEIRNILKKRFSENVFQPQTVAHQATNISQTPAPKILHEKFINHLNQTIELHYQESSTNVIQIATAMAMSERQFFRKLKNILDMTPAEYLRRFRLEKAKALLELERSVSYVTFEVGFSSQSYFGKCFKAQFGVSPREFKKTLST